MTVVERLTQALLADRPPAAERPPIDFAARCFACGIVMGKNRDGRFCTARCRSAYDSGGPAWGRGETQMRIAYRWLDGRPMRSTATGFLINCANCQKEFDSKGLRCCSPQCERGYHGRQANLATMAEVGIEPAAKKCCLQCGGTIPQWRKGKRVSSHTRFCSEKCGARHRRQNPADVGQDAQKPPGNIDAPAPALGGYFTDPGWREVISPDGVRCFVANRAPAA